MFSKTFETHLIHLRDVLDGTYGHISVDMNQLIRCGQRTNLCGPGQSTGNCTVATPSNKEEIALIFRTHKLFSFVHKPIYGDCISINGKTRKIKTRQAVWTENEREAFHPLRTAFTSKSVLRAPHPDKPMIIYADASKLSKHRNINKMYLLVQFVT